MTRPLHVNKGEFKKCLFKPIMDIVLCLTKPEALKSLYRSPGNKKKQLVLCKNYVLQW